MVSQKVSLKTPVSPKLTKIPHISFKGSKVENYKPKARFAEQVIFGWQPDHCTTECPDTVVLEQPWVVLEQPPLKDASAFP